jgi:hypothetical protein
VKPWLARTLLGSAIALALLAGLWLLLDAKWSGEVERLRARPSASVAELLPPIDPAQDAAPIYVEVGQAWRSWQKAEQHESPKHVEIVSLEGFRPEDHPLAPDPHPAYLDAPEFLRIVQQMQAAAQKPHCRLWRLAERELEPGTFPALAILSQSYLLPAALHAAENGDEQGAWAQFESVLVLGPHLREDPLILSLLLSSAVARNSLGVLPRILERAPLAADQARRLLAIVRRLHPEQDVLRAFDGERVLFAEPAWDSIVEGRLPTGIWMCTDLADSLKLKFLRPWRLLDEAKYFELQEAARAGMVASPWQAQPEPEIPDLFPIAQILGGGFRKLTGAWVLEERHARDLAEITLRLALAHEESGSYPPALDALGELPCEPLTGRPYSYTRAGAGYSLALPVPR